AGLFGTLAPMLWIVDGNFWLLLLLLLLQPPFGTSRQFLISSAIRSVLRFASGMVISLATVRASSARSPQYFGSLIGTLAMGLLLEPIMATIRAKRDMKTNSLMKTRGII